MFLVAVTAAYITGASLFYALITKIAPVQPEETLVKPTLYMLDGTSEASTRKAA